MGREEPDWGCRLGVLGDGRGPPGLGATANGFDAGRGLGKLPESMETIVPYLEPALSSRRGQDETSAKPSQNRSPGSVDAVHQGTEPDAPLLHLGDRVQNVDKGSSQALYAIDQHGVFTARV